MENERIRGVITWWIPFPHRVRKRYRSRHILLIGGKRIEVSVGRTKRGFLRVDENGYGVLPEDESTALDWVQAVVERIIQEGCEDYE